MQQSLRHRGPDDRRMWLDEEAGVAMAFARLAIIDLSPTGAQPMVSASGRYVMSVNGEIYNFRDLQDRLPRGGYHEGARRDSDTATLLAGIDAWGLKAALQHTHGMFALALWDRQARKLFLARDRMGEKPLFYGWQNSGAGQTFLYGSELKALRCHPAFDARVDRDSLSLFMRFGYVPSPRSIFEGIEKVPPGGIVSIDPEDRQVGVEHYWSAHEQAAQAANAQLGIGRAEAVDMLETHLMQIVRRQMISDVPLGAFLSGGIDSSLVVAMMQANSPVPVKTFTIGFEEEAYNEAEHAARVAAHLGTDHHSIIAREEDALEIIPHLPRMYDEPLADNSQIPTYLLSRMAKRNVTVALSGDGADEVFGGYQRYLIAQKMWNAIRHFPAPLRGAAAAAVLALPRGTLNRIAPRGRYSGFGDTAYRAAQALRGRSLTDVGIQVAAIWPESNIVVGGQEPPSAFTDLPHAASPIEQLMALDMVTYLPDDIMAKVDRASMAVSLETRAPYLDHDLVEFALRLPISHKLRGGAGKMIIKELLCRYVPLEMVDRPKSGFSLPIGQWLRGRLRDWGEDLLSCESLESAGYLDPAPIREAWQMHQSGAADTHKQLWTALSFMAWQRELKSSCP